MRRFAAPPRAFARGALAALGLTLAALTGCQVNDGAGFDAGNLPPPESLDDACLAGCELLDSCEVCVPDAAGNCLDVVSCAESCRAAGQHPEYLCVTQVAACDPAAAQACLDGGGVDECHAACGQLEGCDRCLSDPSGNCLDSYACLDACYSDQVAGSACLAALTSCEVDALEACLGDDGAGDDACATACRTIDGCDSCLPDADGNCLSIAACAEACRADWAEGAECVGAVSDCSAESIDACFEADPPADDCEAGCVFLDECGYCATDEAGECLEVAACAERCRAEDPTANACLNGLASCDEDAIVACLSPVVEPGDDCDRACLRLDGCELCWPDDEGNCLAVDACAESCRAGDPAPEIALCLAAAEACEAIDPCFSAPPIPDCTGACDALNACGALPPGDPAEVLATCKTACDAGWTEAERACIAREAQNPECGAVATCVAATPPPALTTCAEACDVYLACEALDAEGVGACVERCEAAAGDGRELACLNAAGEDCAERVRCLEGLEPQVPDCAFVCERDQICERLAGEGPEALAECVAACEALDDRAQRICVGEASAVEGGEDACAAHNACFAAEQ